jgi:hypothetical protein
VNADHIVALSGITIILALAVRHGFKQHTTEYEGE